MVARVALLGLLLVLAAGSVHAGLQDEVEAARGIANSERRDALPRLLALYRSPPAPRAHVREQLAPVIAFAFGRGEHARAFLEAFNDELRDPEHAWLAHQVFLEWMDQRRPDRVRLAVNLLVERPFHRAAALEALARRPGDEDRRVAQSVLAALPTEPVARAVLTEAAARLLVTGWAPDEDLVRDPTFVLLVTRFDDPEMHDRTRLVVGRMLARALDADAVYVTGDAWRAFAERRQAREKLAREGYHPGSSSVPTFMGIAAAGRDICYVLDVSGSMATPIQGRPSTRRGGGQLPRSGPVTPRASPRDRERPEPRGEKSDALRGLEDLPWSEIETRLDLVREALKASLRTLDEDQRFSIILFNQDARPLDFTERPRRATPQNVKRACREIDKVTAGGGTNLHRGLELGFGMTEGGLVGDEMSTAEACLMEGFDTIFVLTDGHPNVDSYSSAPSRLKAGALRSAGPLYAETANILLAVRHMNLFRRCEIHCVGMGSSPRGLLLGLAELGHGKARFLGY